MKQMAWLCILVSLAFTLPLSLWAQEDPSRYWRGEWPSTDFGKKSIELGEIISGGPPKDGIPPIDKPSFVSIAQAVEWLAPEEPVLVFGAGDSTRAYPLLILIRHEIVNDVVGGQPVAITFCPLCNSALVFDRRIQGRVLDFGTTGKLRNSDLVMWDRQTESWWQQITGEAIVGELTGFRLTFLPAPLVSFKTFRENYPAGVVLSRNTGHHREYGSNPYVGYDNPLNTQPFLFRQRVDSRLPAVERVVALEVGAEAKAYPYAELEKVRLVNDRLGGKEVVVFFAKGTRSALDNPIIRGSRDVGTGAVFERRLDGRTLTFIHSDGRVMDEETGSSWNILGFAVEGTLKGKRLTQVVHGNHFAFAWLAFRPDSQIYSAP